MVSTTASWRFPPAAFSVNWYPPSSPNTMDGTLFGWLVLRWCRNARAMRPKSDACRLTLANSSLSNASKPAETITTSGSHSPGWEQKARA